MECSECNIQNLNLIVTPRNILYPTAEIQQESNFGENGHNRFDYFISKHFKHEK